MTIASSPRTIVPSPYNDREKTLSVIYSPHGVSYDVIRPYASSYLVSESALPLTALLHSFDCVENPWWLGGNISAGSPGGTDCTTRSRRSEEDGGRRCCQEEATQHRDHNTGFWRETSDRCRMKMAPLSKARGYCLSSMSGQYTTGHHRGRC